MKINRKIIIAALEKHFKPNRQVYAFWLEGADSNNAVDAYSDIDIWFDVTDGQEDKIMCDVQKIFSKLGELDLVHKYNHPDSKIKQTYFHIKGTPEFLLLDVCIQSHSRLAPFIREKTHEAPLAIFDKKKVTKLYPLNHKAFAKELKTRVEDLQKTVAQKARMTKYIHRNNFLETISYYHKWILQPLVEILRIKYLPITQDVHLSHISHHLPKKIVDQIENLYKVNSVKDIALKSKKAINWFNKTVKSL